ncbi:hypothetical protein [Oryzobacter telluris]|uniref:hypothetical protein n=1 Tax=Oryzobacter telluris TaxID=3149179 RepID=UPI00370DB250
MSRTHDDDAPVEHDPTGMRALLASLPDPGPMPDDLVARITAALSAEGSSPGLHAVPDVPDAAPRFDDDAPVPAWAGTPDADGVSSGATVVPLRRRSWGRHLAVAAAVVGAVGLGGVALQATNGGLVASFDATSGGGADSGASMAEGSKDQGGSAPQAAPAAGSGEVVVVLTDTAYSSADLGSVARLTAVSPPQALRDLAAEAPSLGPIATSIGARSCADALGIAPTAGLLVDLAQVDGAPAAVIIATEETGRSAWAVQRSCTTGTTGLIRGPVPLG